MKKEKHPSIIDDKLFSCFVYGYAQIGVMNEAFIKGPYPICGTPRKKGWIKDEIAFLPAMYMESQNVGIIFESIVNYNEKYITSHIIDVNKGPFTTPEINENECRCS